MKVKNWIFILIICASTLIASRDLFKKGYFSMHDDLQIGRLYEMDLCFRDGQIPCRWVPDMGYSYGYPLFNYYPPFPFYSGEILHGLGFSYINSVKILFGLGFFVSGILMFMFTRKLWGDWGGLLSSVLYIFAPYHSVDVYVRGAMNEHWALAFFPGVVGAIYEIIDNDKEKNKLRLTRKLALFFGLLLLSHNLMAFIFTPIAVVFAFLLIWTKKKNLKRNLINLVFGSLWGVGIAAFFTLPVIFEKKLVHVETMLMGYFNYLAHFVSIGKMLFTRFWGYGSSGWLQETGMPFQVGFPQWPLAVLVLIVCTYLFLKKKVNKEKYILILFFFATFLFTLFLVHPRSVFIWDAIPTMAYLQFPWRFLTLVIFAMSVVGGGIIIFFKNEKWQKYVSLTLVVATILLNFSFFRAEKNLTNVTDTEKLFSAKGWRKLQTDAIFDYLPKYAKAPPGSAAPTLPEIKEGSAKITNITKGTNWYKFDINSEDQSKIEVPIYDFPVWKAYVNQKNTTITHDNFLGLITISVPKGESKVELQLTNSFIRTFANIISLISVILLFITTKKKKLKKIK